MKRVSFSLHSYLVGVLLLFAFASTALLPDRHHAIYSLLARSPLHVLLVGSGGIYASPTMYGGEGSVCKGTSGTISNMIKKDFGWSTDLLDKKYQKDTASLLCNDHWQWKDAGQDYQKASEVLAILQWPADLLQKQYLIRPLSVQGLRQIDPDQYKTQQEQTQAQQKAADDSANQSTGVCDWVPDLVVAHPHIDICYPVRGLIHAADTALQAAYANMITQTGSFLWTTPLATFTDSNSQLVVMWNTSWLIVTLFVASVIAWSALRMMIGQSSNWLTYANATEIIPRVVFGLFAAYYSKEIFQEIITGSNALSAVFSSDMTQYISTQPSGVINVVLQIIFVVMNILLIIEGAARMAIIYILFAFAPILLFLASMRETQHFAKNSIVAAVLFILLQPAQAAVLNVGLRVLSTVLNGSAGNLGTLNFLVVIAVLFVALMLFFSVTSMGLGRAGAPLGAAGMGLALGAVAAGPKALKNMSRHHSPHQTPVSPSSPSSPSSPQGKGPSPSGPGPTPTRVTAEPSPSGTRIVEGSLAIGGYGGYGKTPPALPSPRSV